MVIKVMGKRYAKGVGKNGRPFEGFFTSIAYDASGYEGKKCEEKFFSCEVLQGLVPQVGEHLNVSVNFGGFIDSVTRYDKK
jgi:hypothetical protein